MDDPAQFSKRERQIMDVVYRRGEASAKDVMRAMSAPPSRSAVRTFLRILEDKGHLVHHTVGREFVYKPTRPRAQAARTALRSLLGTFFGGSVEQALAAHITDSRARISDEELDRLNALIQQARRRGQ